MEANGLKTRCADFAASHICEKHEPY